MNPATIGPEPEYRQPPARLAVVQPASRRPGPRPQCTRLGCDMIRLVSSHVIETLQLHGEANRRERSDRRAAGYVRHEIPRALTDLATLARLCRARHRRASVAKSVSALGISCRT